MLYVGEGLRGSNGACSALCLFSVTPSATHNQIGPLWCCFPSGWVCARSRPLWVSPWTLLWGWKFLPLPLQPPRVFSIRGLRLYFLELEPWLWGLLRSPAVPPSLSAGECGTTPSTIRCLAGSASPCLLHILSAPLPLSAPPTSPVNVSSLSPWLLDFHTIQFSVSSGCFLFLNLLLSFFWLCEEAQCVYLCLHLGQKSEKYNFNIIFNFFLLFCFQWDDDVGLFHFLLLLVNITSHRKVGV